MPKYWESPEFKKLDKKWQKLLKVSGFEDQEDRDTYMDANGIVHDEDSLKRWSNTPFVSGRITSVQYEAGREYYRAAAHFLWEHSFSTELERNIWELHANGLSFAKIAKALNRPLRSVRTVVDKLVVLLLKKMSEPVND